MRPLSLGFAALLCLGCGSGALAGERYGQAGYPDGYGDGSYGFAGEAIGGSYIGAPLTRFPRPNELVPPAWGYGTYGVPTVTGIRQAPTASPMLMVINTDGPGQRRRANGSQFQSRGANGQWESNAPGPMPGIGGVHVISVTVPRR